MRPCPETLHLLESGLDPSDHCEACRAVSAALAERHADLERAMDHFAHSGNADRAVATALAVAPTAAPWDRRLHTVLVALAAALVVALLWFAATGEEQAPAQAPPGPTEQLHDDLDAAQELSEVPWNALPEEQWADKAHEMWGIAERIEAEHDPLDPEVLPVLHAIYAECGRAAENANNPTEPFYGQVGPGMVNVPWYRAASLALFQPELAAGQGDVARSVGYYVALLESGSMPAHYGLPEGFEVEEPEPRPDPVPVEPLVLPDPPPLDEARALVDEVAAIPWNALSAEDWTAKAGELHALALDAESRLDLDSATDRALLFDTWAQAGRAAENANNPMPPHYGLVAERPVNIAWYRAASAAAVDPALKTALDGAIAQGDKGLAAAITYYLTLIEQGELPGHYDPE